MPRHSTIAAYLALFVALGGVGYAAVNLPKDSVRAKQIDKNAVRTAEVKDGSLLCADFKPSQPACRTPGTTVRSNTTPVPLSCQESSIGPGSFFLQCTGSATITASCSPGERASGGGYLKPTGQGQGGSVTPSGPFSGATIVESRPDPASGTPTGWAIRADGGGGNSGSSPGLARPSDPEVTVYAVCET